METKTIPTLLQQEPKINLITDWMAWMDNQDSATKFFGVLPVMILCLKNQGLSKQMLSYIEKWVGDIMGDDNLDQVVDTSDTLLFGVIYGMMAADGKTVDLDAIKQALFLLAKSAA